MKEAQAWVMGKETGGKPEGIFLVYHPPGQGRLPEFYTSVSRVVRNSSDCSWGLLAADQEDPIRPEELVLIFHQWPTSPK